MKKEIWKKIYIDNIETFYSVSNYGRVINDSKGTILKGNINNNGYVMVHLRYRLDKMCSVHRLVLKAFKPCEEMDDLQVNHIDGNKTNNRLDNLEWSNNLENMRHSYLNGLQKNEMLPCYVYDLNGNYIKEYVNGADAAKDMHLDYNTIHKNLKGISYRCGEFQFRSFKKDKIEEWYNVSANKVYVYTDDGELFKVYNSQNEAAQDFGVGIASISRYINKKRKLKDFVFSKIPL